jgi:DNA-binding MarR family transcriptional regulator
MSRSKAPTRQSRQILLRRVGHELGRELATASLFFHTLVASKVGVNATDTRCLEILGSASSPMTAGALKEATGLTTGAITGILDRLEEAGFVERVRDSQDRRRIFVKLVPDARVKLAVLYEDLGVAMEQLASRYTLKDLQLIEGFLAANLDILKQQIAKLATQHPNSDS